MLISRHSSLSAISREFRLPCRMISRIRIQKKNASRDPPTDAGRAPRSARSDVKRRRRHGTRMYVAARRHGRVRPRGGIGTYPSFLHDAITSGSRSGTERSPRFSHDAFPLRKRDRIDPAGMRAIYISTTGPRTKRTSLASQQEASMAARSANPRLPRPGCSSKAFGQLAEWIGKGAGKQTQHEGQSIVRPIDPIVEATGDVRCLHVRHSGRRLTQFIIYTIRSRHGMPSLDLPRRSSVQMRRRSSCSTANRICC